MATFQPGYFDAIRKRSKLKQRPEVASSTSIRTPAQEPKRPFFEPVAGKVRIRDIIRELPLAKEKLKAGAINLGKEFVRSVPRSMATVALEATRQKELKPETGLEKFLYGKESVKGFQGTGEDFTKGIGIADPTAVKYGAPVGIALTTLDFIPGLGGKKGVVTKAISKTDDVVSILGNLKKIIKGSDEELVPLAERLVTITDPKEVDNIISLATKESKQSFKPVSRVLNQSDITTQFKDSNIPENISLSDYLKSKKTVENQKKFWEDNARKQLDTLSESDVTVSKSSTSGKWVYDIGDGRKAPSPFSTKQRTIEYANKQKQEAVNYLKDGYVKGNTANIEKIHPTESQLTDIWNKAQPQISKPVTRERGFVTSVKEVIPEASKVAGQYVVRSTDELAIKAKNFVADNIDEAEKVAMNDTSDEAIAITSELIKKYGDDAAKAGSKVEADMFYDKAAEVANHVAAKLTELGRSIQAASILGRLTPEGQLRFAAREIQRFNRNPLNLKKIPELTGEQAGKILNDMDEIGKMDDGIEKAQRFKQVQDDILDLVPTPLMKKITTVWKAGLLTGMKTLGLNIFSTAAHATSEIVKDVPAAVVDSVASLFTGKRTKTATLRGLGQGTKDGFFKGVDYFKTGFDERNAMGKPDYRRINFGKGLVGRAFQKYTDTIFRAIASSDQPFYYGAVARSLWDQALAKGKTLGLKGSELKRYTYTLVENPTEEMVRYATADASVTVFQNETALGKAAEAIQKVPLFGEIAVPFGRTPSAVAMQIINYTPVGPAIAIAKQIRRGAFDQRLFSEAVGRGLTGSAVLSLGYMAGKKGLVSLDRPKDEREQKLWELEGRKPNSIKIGDKWRSPIVLGPMGNLLLVGAHFNDAIETTGSPTEAMAVALTGSLKSFTEQTFLTGVNQFVTALNDPDRYGEAYLGNLVSSIVPTLASDIARSMDPLERRPENIPERVKARIPGLRKTVEPKITALGEEQQSVGNPLEILLDPTRPSKDISSPTVIELRRLTDAGQKVSPTLLGDKKGYAPLTKKQNTELWKRSGQIANSKLTNLFNIPKYNSLSDEKKGEIVEDVIEKSKTVARTEMVIQLTAGLNGPELVKKLSELKAGELLTSDVFKLYQETR